MSHTSFTKALLDPSLAVPDGLLDGFGGSAGRRFSVYRNNVTVSLIEALEAGFPAIRKLIGAENFKNIARDYLRIEPPSSPLMMLYGKGFAQYIAGLQPLAKYGYLPDVARFEYLLRESYHAADAPLIAPAALADVAPDKLADVKLILAPAVRLIQSPWPVLSLWRYNTEDGAGKPAARAESVLISRPEYDPTPHLLSIGADRFVSALMLGEKLGNAASQASEICDEFDLSTALSTLLTSQAISSIELEEET